jgi:hypothetical protein
VVECQRSKTQVPITQTLARSPDKRFLLAHARAPRGSIVSLTAKRPSQPVGTSSMVSIHQPHQSSSHTYRSPDEPTVPLRQAPQPTQSVPRVFIHAASFSIVCLIRTPSIVTQPISTSFRYGKPHSAKSSLSASNLGQLFVFHVSSSLRALPMPLCAFPPIFLPLRQPPFSTPLFFA